MLSIITGSRGIKKLAFRLAVTTNLCQKYLLSQSAFVLHTEFIGYVGISRKHYNNRHYMRSDITWRPFSSKINENESSQPVRKNLDPVQFEKISGETLESLTEHFDELVDQAVHLNDADVSYSDGVLTVKFGSEYGTYVINRQTPNKQIWFSSPRSGPKRYDFVGDRWVYKHDSQSLHQLLDNEIPTIVKNETTFGKCLYGRSKD